VSACSCYEESPLRMLLADDIMEVYCCFGQYWIYNCTFYSLGDRLVSCEHIDRIG
jgi:hypothetical protein